MQNLYNNLKDLLQQDERLVVDGKLLKNKIIELALAMDGSLLKLLLSNAGIKKHFFSDVEGVLVFDKIKFQKFISNKQFLPDSFTAFKNKIGLTANDEFITESKEVVLAWPYKDCVLEGGQTKEDAKRSEVFWNETLAPDEIDLLLSPKVLTNFKKYDKDGEHPVFEVTLENNLIIKGNNLLSLHTLLKVYRGRIKLIYIDPPYNTGGDSFQYNDSFNHSTWLSFMRNRLLIARDLLRNDGVIFIQCDDNEQAYLRVLCDEIFNRQNFVDTFIWKNTDNAPALSKKTRKNIEFIHCYEKRINKSLEYRGRLSDNDDAPLLNSGNPIKELNFQENIIHFNIEDGTYKKGAYDGVELLNDLIVENGLNKNSIKLKGKFKWGQDTVDNEIRNGTYFLIKTQKMSIRYQRVNASTMAPDKLIDETYLSKAIGVATNEDARKEINGVDVDFNSFPKPESLISFLIQAVTVEGDIILDFFAGSGTTGVVAHKLKRKYILCEQMGYVESTIVKRLNKVINGEQGGISKTVNWQGGGSFIFCELAKVNQEYIDKIQEASTKEQLQSIWAAMQEKAFISYNVNIAAINDKATGFDNLTIEEQQKFLIEILDKNLLYVPYSSIDDKDYNISEDDKKLNRQFYSLK